MGREVLVGIDLGTTVLKAAAYDAATGRLLARASEHLPVRAKSDGTRELTAPAVDRALAQAAARLAREVGRPRRRVAGIGLAAQGGSSLVARRSTGKPLTALILWNDRRGSDHLARLRSEKPVGFWRRHLLRDTPALGMGRLAWMRRTRPELFVPDNIFCGAGEYVYFRLTGVWRQDAGHAIQTGCYSARRKCLDERLIGLTGVPLSMVAPLRVGHETSPLAETGARLLGLVEGVPVAGPYMDHEAGYLSAAPSTSSVPPSRAPAAAGKRRSSPAGAGPAAGALRAERGRPLQVSLGTAWVGNFILGENAKWNSPYQLVLPAVVGEGWLVVQPLLTGNVTWDWGLEHLLMYGRDKRRDHARAGTCGRRRCPDRALREAARIFAEELLPPEGLTALPWFNAANPLRPAVPGRADNVVVPTAPGGGAFLGIDPHTSRANLLRALAASMAYEMARVFDEVRTSGAVDRVVLGGGAARGEFFRTLLAALFSPLPVFVAEGADLAGTRGVLFPFSRKAARARTVRVGQQSASLARRVARGFDLYLAAFERLYGDVPAGGRVSLAKRKGAKRKGSAR